MISRLLDDQSIARRKRGRKTQRGRTTQASLRSQRPRVVRRTEPGALLVRMRTTLQIGALTVAVGALVAGVVLIGRDSPAAEALSRSVVSDEMQQAAVSVPGPVAGDLPGAPAQVDESAGVEFERTEDVEYVVTEGETLSEIADRYDLAYEDLADYNDLANPHTLKPGQKIIIPREKRISDLGSAWDPIL